MDWRKNHVVLREIKTLYGGTPQRESDGRWRAVRYVLSGRENGRPLVFLNDGMNTLEMWMDYVDGLSEDYRVLLFDYPQQLRTNQALVAGMHAFFRALGI